MNMVWIIALNTFREAVRDRVLYNLVFFALVMMGAAILVGQISIGIERLIIINLGLTAISLFGVVMAIFIGVGLVYKEMERRTLYALLTKPIHRWQFIVGKYAGLILTLAVNTALMTVGLLLALFYVNRSLVAGDLQILLAVYFILLQLSLMTGIALLLSSFATPIVSMVCSLGLFVVGSFSPDIKAFGEMSKTPWMEWLSTAVYYVLPNFSAFNVITAVAHGRAVPIALVLDNSLYALMYSVAVAVGAVAIFSNRNLK
jgi:ABC-type transport system involved in multi-copper enzyme maturation permease subunit